MFDPRNVDEGKSRTIDSRSRTQPNTVLPDDSRQVTSSMITGSSIGTTVRYLNVASASPASSAQSSPGGCQTPLNTYEEALQRSNDAVAAGASTANSILVHPRQKKNPVLKCIKNVGIEYNEFILPDYVLGSSTCALFLSVRYHMLHPDYLQRRLGSIGREFRVRVLLCLVDIEDNQSSLQQINNLALKSEFTLILAWSLMEAARYLETFKAYEHKSASLIQERVESEYLPKLTDVLTTVRSVNKTDVVTLASTFGSFTGICQASMEQLALCPGFGEKKVRHLFDTFNEPFLPPTNTPSNSQSYSTDLSSGVEESKTKMP